MATAQPIKVRYSSVDGFRETRSFKTVEGARRFLIDRVGAEAEVSSLGYAVSADGVGKVSVEGADLQELLTGKKRSVQEGLFGIVCVVYDDELGAQTVLRGRYDTIEDQLQALDYFQQTDHAEAYHLPADWKDGRWVEVLPLYNGKTAAEVVAETYGEIPF